MCDYLSHMVWFSISFSSDTMKKSHLKPIKDPKTKKDVIGNNKCIAID